MAKNFLSGQALCTVLLASLFFGLGFDASAQSLTNSPTPASTGGASGATSTATAYDVVSIRPDNSGNRSGQWRNLPDGFEWTNVSLYFVIRSAYGIIMDSQVKGLPAWAESEPYDIQTKVDADTAAVWQKMTRKEREKQERPMIQALLADRCKFKAHEETRELPVYDLVIAKGGLKAKEASTNETGSWFMNAGTIGTMTVNAMPVNAIGTAFSTRLGRMIMDKTGLGAKKFDFELKWTPDDRLGVNNAIDAPPSLFTALEEQLGLKLVPAKGPVKVLVIDHMERPSAN